MKLVQQPHGHHQSFPTPSAATVASTGSQQSPPQVGSTRDRKSTSLLVPSSPTALPTKVSSALMVHNNTRRSFKDVLFVLRRLRARLHARTHFEDDTCRGRGNQPNFHLAVAALSPIVITVCGAVMTFPTTPPPSLSTPANMALSLNPVARSP